MGTQKPGISLFQRGTRLLQGGRGQSVAMFVFVLVFMFTARPMLFVVIVVTQIAAYGASDHAAKPRTDG